MRRMQICGWSEEEYTEWQAEVGLGDGGEDRGGGGGWAGLNLGMQLPQTSRVRRLNQINTVGATRVSAFIRFALNSREKNTDTGIMSVAGVRGIKRPSPKKQERKKLHHRCDCDDEWNTAAGGRGRERGRVGELGAPCRSRASGDGKGQLSMKMQMSSGEKTAVPTGLGGVASLPPPPPPPTNFPRLHGSLTYRQRAPLQLKAGSITAKRVCGLLFFFPSLSRTLSDTHRQMMFDFRALETFNGVHSAINLAGGVG